MGYSFTGDAETTALALGREIPCSPKHSENVVRAIKGMTVAAAKAYLEQVIALKKAVRFLTENHKVHHRRGQGFGPGAYPVKAAGAVLQVVINLENNAEYKGLDVDDLIIVHASAHPGRIIKGFLPRAHGRASPFNETTTNIELALGPRPGEEEEVRRHKKPAAGVTVQPGRKKAPVAEGEAPSLATEAEPAAEKGHEGHGHGSGEHHEKAEKKQPRAEEKGHGSPAPKTAPGKKEA
jgi:large subunit ribosomal protein L22